MAAPEMAGMLMRNESRAASSAERPRTRPAEMVDPDRETPGQMAAAWAKPITTASPMRKTGGPSGGEAGALKRRRLNSPTRSAAEVTSSPQPAATAV